MADVQPSSLLPALDIPSSISSTLFPASTSPKPEPSADVEMADPTPAPDEADTTNVPGNDDEPSFDEYDAILARVLAMHLLSSDQLDAAGVDLVEGALVDEAATVQATDNEQELAHLVLRLLHDARFFQSQVALQAEALEHVHVAHEFVIKRAKVKSL